MNRSTKAALLSALVFPGLGHMVLGRALRGCLFLLPAGASAIYVARDIRQRASLILDQVQSGALPADPQLIAEQVAATSNSGGSLMTVAIAVLAICWVGSIIDSFLAKPA
ncbi:hypothetical protein [Janthinobacterium agaricidamnosum]|nr:hypothetical protein [Janthinobacterium agaricidamnosum]